MKISIIGSGYIGTISAACFADVGHEVICVDIDERRVQQINKGIFPIYEEGLEELLKRYAGKNLVAIMDHEYAVLNTNVSFICVGPPSKTDGSISISTLRTAIESIGSAIAKKNSYHVVVIKSTAFLESTEKSILPILEEKSGKVAGKDFGIAVNPEFLREGKAIYDFRYPEKIIIGSIDSRSGNLVSELYQDFKCAITLTDLRTAEMIKYANNSLMATKIFFSNEIENICKRMGIDTYEVMKAVSEDSRISPYFLNPEIGLKGACFPRDILVLVSKAREIGYSPVLLETVLENFKVQKIKSNETTQRL